MRLLFVALLAVLAITAGHPSGALAKPAAGCAGLSFADARDDATEDAFGLGFGPAAPPRMDVVAGWLREEGGKVTANIQLADLTAAPPNGGGTSAWTFNWFAGAQRFYVQASVNANGTRAFSYGTYDEASASFRPESNTTIDGAFFEGPDGVVQIELPAQHARSGVVLERPFAEAAEQVGSSRAVSDRAPDAREGDPFRVGGCIEGGPVTPRAKPVKKKVKETLPLRSVKVLGSAAKSSKRRSIGFKVRGLKTITGLKVRLTTRGGKVLAAGGMRKLKGVRGLKLSLRKTVRLHKGSYLLRASGRVRNRPLKTVIKVSVRA